MELVARPTRRTGSTKKASSAKETSRIIKLPDLRQVTVLSKNEWLRIQNELYQVDKEKKSALMEAEQREALHLESVQAVKQWSNTFAGQRQNKLEAKKIREEIAEKKWEETDKKEAEYQEKKRKEAIEKAKTQLYYQTDRVRGLHRALLLTEVVKEREAQIELKRRIKSASKDVDKQYCDILKTREDEALKREREKALQKKRERQAVAEDQKQQIRQVELGREREKIENKKDGERLQHLKDSYQWEQRMEKERQAKQKRDLMQAHLEQLTNREIMRVAEAKKQEAEEEQRKLFLSAKEKMMELRKEREAEVLREAQAHREMVMDQLIATQQELKVNEEHRIKKAVAEQDAKQAQRQWEEEEKKAAVLKSIAAYRESLRLEKEQRDKMAKQNTRDDLEARKEADRIFLEKQQMKSQQIKEDGRQVHVFNIRQMAENNARRQQLRREVQEFEEKTAELIAEEENQFRHYSQQVIKAASEAQQNLFPLYKAAREGLRGLNPQICLVQDQTAAHMARDVSGVSQELSEAVPIEAQKKRLGFTW